MKDSHIDGNTKESHLDGNVKHPHFECGPKDSHLDGDVKVSHRDGSVKVSHLDGSVKDSHLDGDVKDSHLDANTKERIKSDHFDIGEEQDGNPSIQPLSSIPSHQSGVNAIDFTCFDTQRKLYLVASGGDDTALCVALVKLQPQSVAIVNKKTRPSAHYAAITGMVYSRLTLKQFIIVICEIMYSCIIFTNVNGLPHARYHGNSCTFQQVLCVRMSPQLSQLRSIRGLQRGG